MQPEIQGLMEAAEQAAEISRELAAKQAENLEGVATELFCSPEILRQVRGGSPVSPSSSLRSCPVSLSLFALARLSPPPFVPPELSLVPFCFLSLLSTTSAPLGGFASLYAEGLQGRSPPPRGNVAAPARKAPLNFPLPFPCQGLMEVWKAESMEWAEQHFVLTRSGFLHWFESTDHLLPVDAMNLGRCSIEAGEPPIFSLQEVRARGALRGEEADASNKGSEGT